MTAKGGTLGTWSSICFVRGNIELQEGGIIFNTDTYDVANRTYSGGKSTITVSGGISQLVGTTGSVVKTGKGTLVLSGNNTFTGGVVMKDGLLRLTSQNACTSGIFLEGGMVSLEHDGALGSIGGRNVTVTSSGELISAVNGGKVVLDTLTMNQGSSLYVNGKGVIGQTEMGSLVIGNGLTGGRATFVMDLNASQGLPQNDNLKFTRALTLGNSDSLYLDLALGSGFVTGRYILLTGIGAANADKISIKKDWGRGLTLVGGMSGADYVVDISGAFYNSTINWQCSGTSGKWSLAESSFWDDSSGYYNGDTVVFGVPVEVDTETGLQTVVIEGNLSPVSVSVTTEKGKSYLFTGDGGIKGNGGLTKEGEGSLIFSNSNTNAYGGETVVEGGILEFRNGSFAGTGNITVKEGAIFQTDAYLSNRMDVQGILAFNFAGKESIDLLGMSNVTWGANSQLVISSGSASSSVRFIQNTTLVVKEDAAYRFSTECDPYPTPRYSVEIGGHGLLDKGKYTGAIYNTAHSWTFGYFNEIALSSDALISVAMWDNDRNTTSILDVIDFKLNNHKLTISGKSVVLQLGYGTTPTIDSGTVSVENVVRFLQDCRDGAVFGDSKSTIEFKGDNSRLLFNAWAARMGTNVILNNTDRDSSLPFSVNNFAHIFPACPIAGTIPVISGELKIINGGVIKLEGDLDPVDTVGFGNHLILSGDLSGTGTLYVSATGNHYTASEDTPFATDVRVRHLYLGGNVADTMDGVELLGNAVLQIGTYQVDIAAVSTNATIKNGLNIVAGSDNLLKIVPSGSDASYTGLNFTKRGETGVNLIFRSADVAYKATVKDTTGAVQDIVLDKGSKVEISGTGTLLTANSLRADGTELTVSGGVLTLSRVQVGGKGDGSSPVSMVQSGGSVNVSGEFILGGVNAASRLKISDGILNVDKLTVGGVSHGALFQLTGGRLNIGAGGISAASGMSVDDANVGFYLSGGVLGALADWQTTSVLNLTNESGSEGVVVNTTLATAAGSAASITLAGAVRGSGGLIVRGLGVLSLSAVNNYQGDTILESGSLYVGTESSLGTGKLVIQSGAVLSALSKAVVMENGTDLGRSKTGEGFLITFGSDGHKGALTLGGLVNVASHITQLETKADVSLGNVVSNSPDIVKTGSGKLTFLGDVSGVKTVEVQTGMLTFGTGGNGAKNLESISVWKSSGVDLGGQDSFASLYFAESGTLSGASSYVGKMNLGVYANAEIASASWVVNATGNTQAGTLFLNNQNARLNVDSGGLQLEGVVFTLGEYNAAPNENSPNVLVTADSVDITGKSQGSIHLNFDIGYVNTHLLSGGGRFQLFSSPVTYVGMGVITYSQPQILMVDSSQLGVDGSIIWREVDLRAVLLPEDMMEGSYTPSNFMDYLGADYNNGSPIIVGENVIYTVPEDTKGYQLTPGKGTLIYQGHLDTAGKGVYVADYSDVTKEEGDRCTGSVILTNNTNSYEQGTNISGTTLIVDLSLGVNPDLVSDVQNGNLDVHVLGTGDVTVTSGKMKWGGTLLLQSYGNDSLAGATTYTYANNFRIEGGSTLKQAGKNDQIITGDVTSGTGKNAFINSSERSLIFKGNVTQLAGGSLLLSNETALGTMAFDGKEKMFVVDSLRVTGLGSVVVRNGYTVKTSGAVISDGKLILQNEGILFVGSAGITGTGMLVLNGGTIRSSSSWNSDSVISVGAGTNTINTGGANVRLNRGVTGEGGFEKQGTGFLYVYDSLAANAKGVIDVKQGRLVLLGALQDKTRTSISSVSEYKLNGNLVLTGKGASLQGMIDANGHTVTFGENTNFYMSIDEQAGITGYIRNADTISFGTGTQLRVDALNSEMVIDKAYTVFQTTNGTLNADNLVLTLEEEFEFVNVKLDRSDDKKIDLLLTKKGENTGEIVRGENNKDAINAVVVPLVAGVLTGNTSLTGKLYKTMQIVSKMTESEYQVYLGDMGGSFSSFYTALSAQVQDATLHINSVRNRVELLTPVMYDDWKDGGIYNVWAGGISHYRDVKSDYQSPGYEMTSWGGELGCAVPLSQHFMLGVGFAYTFTDVQVKDGWGTNENDTYSVDIFARYKKNRLTLTGVLTGGFSNVEFHRNQRVLDEFTRSNSSADGNLFLGTLEAGYDLYLNEEKNWILQPLVNVTAGRAKMDGLSETGELKNAGLIIGSQSYNMFSAGVGAKIAYEYKTDLSDLPGRLEFKAMYVNDMGDVDFNVNGRFIGAPENSFDLKGVSNERSSVILSVGWIAPISEYGQFFADASCEFRKDQNGVSSTVGFSFQF